MKINKQEFHKYELEHYTGSLDFPCDFCGLNSYDNFHISRNGVMIVVCQDCLDKVKEEEYENE